MQGVQKSEAESVRSLEAVLKGSGVGVLQGPQGAESRTGDTLPVVHTTWLEVSLPRAECQCRGVPRGTHLGYLRLM